MESSVKMVEKVKEEMDISNFLPEPVFSYIISSLPLKEAVRTSVLVKRWKHAWKYVTRLDLDPASISEPIVEVVERDSGNGMELTPTRRSMADLIRCTSLYTSIIRSIRGKLTHCQIYYFPININSGDLEKWVKELLMTKKVKALSLICDASSIADGRNHVKPLVLRRGSFSPLECLELTGYRVFTTSPFQNCENLRILKLSNLELGSQYITKIFSFCESLEELSMLHCHGFSKMEISSRNLKFLELRCLDIENINVSAEALMTLILYEITCELSFVVINAPRVTKLQACWSFEDASLEDMEPEYMETYVSYEKLLERCTGFLECLELTGYRLLKTSPFQSCQKLRILKLSNLKLGSKSITEIFSFCEDLEEFSMLHCLGFSKLEISSRNLKFLELRCLNIGHVNISAEALITLIFYNITCTWSFVVINAPRVTELQACCSVEGASPNDRVMYLTQEKLLERCTGFLSCYDCPQPLYFSQTGYVSAFRNLQVLSTSLDLNDIRHAILLSYILRVCSQLKRLDITVKVRDRFKVGKLNYPEHLYWERKEIFDCISNCLRAVSIQNFKGKVLEMEFVKYIITRSPQMHRVTVKCAKSCTREEVTATRSLLSLPKSSMNVAVTIVPPSPQQVTSRTLEEDGSIM